MEGQTLCYGDDARKVSQVYDRWHRSHSVDAIAVRAKAISGTADQVASSTFSVERCPTNTDEPVNAGGMTILDSQQAAINISCRFHGAQLDTTTMTAIEVDKYEQPILKPYDGSSTKLELLFGSESDLTEFINRYRELQQVVESHTLLRVPTNASSRLSSSSRRRDSGTAHAN